MGPYNKPQASSFKADPNPNSSASDLASKVGETRSAITSDIQELGNKSSPSHLKEEAKDAAKDIALSAKDAVVDKAIEVKDAVVDKAVEVKDAIVEKTSEVTDAAVVKLDEAKEVVSDALDNAGDTAARIGRATWRFTSANAVPLALVGLGAGWMIANGRASSRQPTKGMRKEVDARIGSDLDRPTFAGNGSQGSSRTRERQARDSGRQPARREHTDMVQRGKTEAKRAVAMTRTGLVRATEASREFAKANPLALALGTMVVGLGVGLLLPTTDRETKLLAPAREKFDRMIGDAREVASDVVEMAKETATETMARS